MATERIIGVDFGTSTSVIRVKRYQDGKPVGDRLEVKPVKFNMGKSEIVPTLIRKLPSGDAYFGYEAEAAPRKTEPFQNFKVNIDNPDEATRQQARELTAKFFKYLAKTYEAQSEGSHLGEIDDRQRTIISYPVKWDDEKKSFGAKSFLLQTAKDAGFPHVEGIDEAQAAIQAVTIQNTELLTRKGYFQEGFPVNILLIDMGAGTTDLVLCRHTPGASPKTDILNTWPALFGGQEVDELLSSYIRRLIPEERWGQVQKRVGIEKYKSWKESIVSPALQKKETIDTFTALDDRLEDLDIEIEYSIDRASFEDHAAVYLRKFPELVNGCLEAAGVSGDDVDLVILTGGHSQWYFVREMLIGKLDRFGRIGLGKIQTDPERVIPITLPQETVALGLAYMPMKVEVPEPKPDKEDKILPSIAVAKEIRVDNPAQEDVFPLKYDPYSRIRPVIACSSGDVGSVGTIAVKRDGGILKTSDAFCRPILDVPENFNDWKDIVTVAFSRYHAVGLKKDGTVVISVVDSHDLSGSGASVAYSHHLSANHICRWKDIIAIAVGKYHTIGLKRDGTIVCEPPTGDIEKRWDDIIAISVRETRFVGLKRNGTVNLHEAYQEKNIWNNIVAIATSNSHTIGLQENGKVMATGSNMNGKCNVGAWSDIVSIACGNYHTVGLKSDGTVVATGYKKRGACNVEAWSDIIAIACGDYHTIGLKRDGTLVSAGEEYDRSCLVGGWNYRTEEKMFGFKLETTRFRQTPWKLF